MIEYKKGNLLDVTSGVIAHGVNCQGVMGSGVALAIRKKYPEVYQKYHKDVTSWKEGFGATFGQIGRVQFVPINKVLIIANCFTQDFYGTLKRHVDYDAVAVCFSELNKWKDLYGQLNVPKIGAGLGGGDWDVIESIIKSEYKSDVIVWEL